MKIVLLTDTHWGYSPAGDFANEQMLAEIKASVEPPFIIIHSGDMGSHDRVHREAYSRLLRHYFPVETIGVVLGNHDHWMDPKPAHWRVGDVINNNREILATAEINYLPDSPIEEDGVYVCGFNGWYFNLFATSESRIPHLGDPSDGRVALGRYAREGFERCLKELEEARARGLKTVLVTHFGCVEEASKDDWKSKQTGVYFGANPTWEDFLGNVDYYLYGHSHQKFEGVAKNGHTKVFNTGSDYEKPKYLVLNV